MAEYVRVERVACSRFFRIPRKQCRSKRRLCFFEDIEVTVNTGSTYTAVPRKLLQRLGVPVERSLPSETADGRTVPVDVGRTTIRLEGLEFSTPVVFGEEGEPSLLGVVSPEEAALAVDPLAGRLIPANLLRL